MTTEQTTLLWKLIHELQDDQEKTEKRLKRLEDIITHILITEGE